MTARKQLDPEATRQAIIDAADALFVESGLDGVSLSQIAKRAEVTKSLIHHHFGSKQELWEEVKRRHFEGFMRVQQSVIDKIGSLHDDSGAVAATMRTQFDFRMNDPAIERLATWSYLSGEPSAMVVMADVMVSGMEKIRAAQECGSFRDDVSPLAMLHMMLGSVQSWFMFRHIFEASGLVKLDEGQDEQVIEEMIRIVLRGIAAHGEEPVCKVQAANMAQQALKELEDPK